MRSRTTPAAAGIPPSVKRALQANTTGTNNTASGQGALAANTTARDGEVPLVVVATPQRIAEASKREGCRDRGAERRDRSAARRDGATPGAARNAGARPGRFVPGKCAEARVSPRPSALRATKRRRDVHPSPGRDRARSMRIPEGVTSRSAWRHRGAHLPR